MQRNSGSSRGTQARRFIWPLVGLALLIFITVGTVFPGPWNSAMAFLKDKTGYRLPYFSDNSYTLGLDLQGGAHLVYEADMSAIPETDRDDALSGVRDVIERRVNAFGVSEPFVQTTSADGHYRVLIDLPGLHNVEEAIAQIGETPVLEFKTPDAKVEESATPTTEEQATIDTSQAAQQSAADAVLARAQDGEDFSALAKELIGNDGYVGYVSKDDATFDGLVSQIEKQRLKPGIINGVYESTSALHIVNYLSKKTEDVPTISHLLVCYEGATGCTNTRSKEEAKSFAEELTTQINKENFADLAKEHSGDFSAADGGDLGPIKRGLTVQSFEDAAYSLADGAISGVVETAFGYHLLYRTSSLQTTTYEIAHIEMDWTTLSDIRVADPWQNTELSGKHIKNAAVGFDQTTNEPKVIITFNSEGSDLFADLTGKNVGKVIGIFLDGEPITTPVVNETIYGGEATISGNFTVQDAKLLAQRLNAGALPVPITVVSQQTIGPSLGQESLNLSVKAGVVGFILIVLFVIVYYRLPGLLATGALVFYALFNLALYKWFGVTITLSGIAGFVLSLGIAVDANVLVFERLKEELQSGRDLPTAARDAFRRAWPSIRDGNFTTLIATAVLYSTITTGFIRGFALTLAIGVLVSLFSSMVITRFLMNLVIRVPFLRKPVLFLGGRKS